MQDTNKVNPRKVNRGGLTHVPSPRWRGAVIAGVLVLTLVILFSYALLDWEWQQQQGGRNYVAVLAGSFAFAFALRAWRNDPRRLFGPATERCGGLTRTD